MKGNIPNESIVEACFSLDYPNYRILQYFTKYGQASRQVVGKHNFQYSPNLQEKQTGRRKLPKSHRGASAEPFLINRWPVGI